MKQSAIKQYKEIKGKEISIENIILPFLLSDKSLREHFEKSINGKWDKTTMVENIKKIIMITNNQVYNHHNKFLSFNAAQRKRIINGVLKASGFSVLSQISIPEFYKVDFQSITDNENNNEDEDIINMIKFLKTEMPSSVGLRSCSFYGGFDDCLTGFELNRDNFLRIFRYIKGATWLTHRPPTIQYPKDANINYKHIDSEALYNKTNIQMYHYSYVFPTQVYTKVNYYKDSVSRDNCIDDYFNKIYLPWVIGDENDKNKIENQYLGVHEFKPNIRGECFTAKFEGQHPRAIENNLESADLELSMFQYQLPLSCQNLYLN